MSSLSLLCSIVANFPELTVARVDDESALRAKVDEALGVYDEYMKTKADTEGVDENAKEGEGEELKA